MNPRILRIVVLAIAATIAMSAAVEARNPRGSVLNALYFGATLPALPQITVNSTLSMPAPAATARGSYYTPGYGSDSGLSIQSAITAAAASNGTNVVVIQAGSSNVLGAANVSAISLPSRASATGWVYICSSQTPELIAVAGGAPGVGTGGTGPLPSSGTRINPSTDSANMAKIALAMQGANNFQPTVYNNVSGNYYRLIGLEITTQPTLAVTASIANGSTTMAVTATSGTLAVGMYLASPAGANIYSDLQITSIGTTGGGTGNYTVNQPGTTLTTSSMSLTAGWQTWAVLEMGDDNFVLNTSQIPQNFVVDRVWMHPYDNSNQGFSQQAIVHGIYAEAEYVSVLDSYVENIHNGGADNQCIIAIQSRGPFKIQNNFLEAQSENILFGGGLSAWLTQVPSDITIQHNTFTKRLAWVPNLFTGSVSGTTLTVSFAPYLGNVLAVGQYLFNGAATTVGDSMILAQTSGTTGGVGTYTLSQNNGTLASQTFFTRNAGGADIKNLLELKMAQRVLVDSNYFSNHWPDGQNYPLALTVRTNVSSGNYPWVIIQDVTFSNNYFRNVVNFANFLATDSITGTGVLARMRFYNNLIYQNDVTQSGLQFSRLATFSAGGSSPYTSGTPSESVIFDHNTMVGPWAGTYAGAGQTGQYSTVHFMAEVAPPYDVSNLVMTNNVVPQFSFGYVIENAGNAGNVALNATSSTGTNWSWSNNVAWGTLGTGNFAAAGPSGNQTDTQANVFVNYGADTPAGYVTAGSYATSGYTGAGLGPIAAGATPVANSTHVGIVNAAAIPTS